MKTHNLKCDPKPFQAVLAGLKTYEVRINDRDYEVGDVLRLHEIDARREKQTGRIVTKRVVYMTAGGTYGLPQHICVLGLADA